MMRVKAEGKRQKARVLFAAGVALSMAAVGIAQQKPADPNDPRINLKPGLRDAGVAARGMELV